MGQNLGECHSGMRAYRRAVLETIPWARNSDDFVFDSQFLVQAVHFGFRIGDIPVPVRYMKEASSISFRRSVTYGLGTLGVLAQWTLHRWGLRRSPLFQPRTGERRRESERRYAVPFRPKSRSSGINSATTKLGTVARITQAKKCR